ncbi:glycosyltransferase family 2 protein [Olleya sp. YS]|uniref:glycosyltransferase family 2 protein n=1 Tax=Olleya sp. YS TaxID=3028318 RepID=UPI0024345C63|nr:glycosyltransferase family 2 protein [Olleya sp. YS]WGD34883.1 glycosyltransferase family 2 protein [Olleya sp. YS]
MIQQPLITVLIPTYNCEQYVHDAVQSILNQTYTNFECIIIDDCSTDGTVDIIKTFDDPRINLIVKPKNSGYTNSLNYGLTIAKGKYIARMDGDDISLPNRFEKQVAIFEQNDDIVVCGSIFKLIDTETIIEAPEHHDAIKLGLLKESCIGHPTAMIRTSVLNTHNINYNTAYEPAEDYDLWVRLSQVGQLYNIQDVLFLYRVHDNQVSITKKEIQRKSASLSRFNMLNQLNLDYTELEKQAYIKQFSYTERLNFEELVALIKLNNKAFKANAKGFFNQENLKTILQTFQTEAINQYFKANKKYSPKMINQLKEISRLTATNFSFLDKVKLYIKSLIFFKNDK